MSFELDHVFLAVSKGAPEADQLLAGGFVEGPPNTHPGQGTACRRIFFENAYLELLWLEDAAEAASALVEPTSLALRTGSQGDASRVGVCLRGLEDATILPIPTWQYRPPYLPEGFSITMASNSIRAREPLLFFLPVRAGPLDTALGHPNGARKVTEVVVTLPALGTWSPELQWLANSGYVRVESGAEESLKVYLDRSAKGASIRLGTSTPLELWW